MNRITSLLALSALVVAGAFAGTAAQASASNVNVDFNVVNGDGSASMIRIGQSSEISGLITPAAAILPGNTDPASGSALFSAPHSGCLRRLRRRLGRVCQRKQYVAQRMHVQHAGDAPGLGLVQTPLLGQRDRYELHACLPT